MAKKTTTELVEANPRTVRAFDFTEADATAAQQLGIVIGGAIGDRVSRAVVSYNMAARLAVEAGYLLLSVKSELAHGEFEAGVTEMGLSSQRASELMRMAKFATALPESQRAELLTLPKTKVLAIASADAEVIEELLNDADIDVADLSVRELRQRIRDLEAANVDASVQRDTVIAERDGLAKQLRKRHRDEEDHEGVPLVVADVRLEATALVKKAELAIGSMYPLGVEMAGLAGHAEAGVWVPPTLRMALSGLVALRVQLDGLIASYVQALGDKVDKLQGQPESLAFLDESEIKSVAEEWARLIALHQHEAALRAHERDQAKPKGKGRPTLAPKAPKA